jgi:hypothetical protein
MTTSQVVWEWGPLYSAGGYIEPTVSGQCEMYCPRTNTWSRVAEMRVERSALSQVVLTWDSVPNLPDYVFYYSHP